jgi:hypothetical protein
MMQGSQSLGTQKIFVGQSSTREHSIATPPPRTLFGRFFIRTESEQAKSLLSSIKILTGVLDACPTLDFSAMLDINRTDTVTPLEKDDLMKSNIFTTVIFAALLPLTVLAEPLADDQQQVPFSQECSELKAELDRLIVIRDEETKAFIEILRLNNFLLSMQNKLYTFAVADP